MLNGCHFAGKCFSSDCPFSRRLTCVVLSIVSLDVNYIID